MNQIRIVALLLAIQTLPSAADERWRLGMESFGPVRPGMSTAEVEKAAGAPLEKSEPIENCLHISGSGDLQGISFMMVDDKVTRMEVWSPKFQTLSGIKIGSTEEEVKRLYGPQLEIEEHHYSAGNYLTLRSRDGRSGIRFETDGTKVTTFYAGPWWALRYVEGCA